MQVGDKVRLNPNITNFYYSRGSANYGDIGIVRDIAGNEIRVDFPTIDYWHGLINEVEIVEDIKHFTEEKTCEDCGKKISEGVEIDGKYYCKDCFNETYFFCRHCGKIEKKENGYFIDNEYYVCENCFNNSDNYTVCEDCGEYISMRNANRVNDGSGNYYYVCGNCVDCYYYCDDCGDRFNEDDLTWRNDNYYCSECLGSHLLYGYHEFDDWVFLNIAGK